MPALLCALLIVFPQDPPVDDIAKRFPDPVAADRTWEMAAAYFEKICGHLRAKEYDEAREWERMARGRLPDPYAKRLAEKGREFWPKFRGFPGNRVEVEDAAAVYVIALIGGDERELAVLKKRVGNDHETRRIIYGFDLAVALTRIGEGELPKALRHFDEMEKFYPEEWVKNALAEKRAAVAAIGEAGSAEGVLKSTGLACWSRETSWGGSLAVLERVRAGLKKGPPAAARKPLMEAAIYVLRSLEDPKAVRAFEDRLAHDPVSSPKESRALMAKRAGEAFQRGDYKLAEALYRQVLNQWPDEPAMGIGFQLGRALQKQEKWAEARGVFEKIAAAKDEDGPREERGFGPKVQDRARFEIGACYEGAGQWAKALAAYLACPDVPRGDGHGREYRDLSIPEAVFRCRVNLKQVDEAMKLGRDHVLETGRRSKHIVVGFIDLAVASGKFDAEEEKLKAVVPKEQPGVGMALDYMRVLKLRRDRDIAGLFAAIKDENLHQDLYQARWEVLRDGASWLTAETVECLAELG
ncbi:MAG TPA: tetratricopeptide repeat protein, partial [Planctomycetota bacterium]|nr:tetratricopeptide repeat protein [Planctomycetota bacterium]